MAERDATTLPTIEGPVNMGSGGWFTTLILCIVLSVVGAFWLKAATFPDLAAGLCEAVPPIPAIATLVFLVVLRLALRGLGARFRLSDAQILLTYAFVSVSVSIGFINLYRKYLSWLTAPGYMANARPGGATPYHRIAPFVPSWLAPKDPTALREYWEGVQGGQAVPWSEWAIPLLGLGGLMGVFYLVSICMLRLFYKRWSREERLSYPVAELAINLVGDDSTRLGSSGPILSTRAFWIGCILALLFNLVYIIPALLDAPQPPSWINAAAWFRQPPWNAGGQWQIRFNPIVFGLGYFVSLDVLFSTWVCFLLLKAQAVFFAARGVPYNSLFHIGELQGMGAYVALAFLMVWSARHHLARAARRVVAKADPDADPMEAGRWTVVFLVAGVLGLLAFMLRAGVATWLALVFLAMLLIRSLVMARIRAQAGMPIIYFEVGSARSLVWLLGGAALANTGMRSVAGYVVMGYLAEATCLVPHHADAFRLAERSRIRLGHWMALAVFAVIFGLTITNLTHLPTLYHYGAVNVGERPSGWQVNEIVMAADQNTPADAFKIGMAAEGAVVTGLLTWLRRFYWFPLHPLGYVIACAIGFRVFAPIFAIWLIKILILKYFGGRTHRKAKVLFLGLVMGHFTIAALWAALALFRWPPTQRYFIGFW